MKKVLQFLFCIILLNNNVALSQQPANPTFEFRAVWVASINNCDWPSNKGLSSDSQKTEFINLANLHQQNGMNALIVQVRPAADALYKSSFEEWSEYLSGTQGIPPTPYYDPLQFMIDETHKRGMEFHAWLNPYRAVFDIKASSITNNHITKKKPHWFINYGGKKYFNPALQEVRDYFLNIIKDIITKYDVDGIHIDDYFYPYPDSQNRPFPDDKFYKQMGKGLSRDDWRRSNCDSIISQIYRTIATMPRRVKFGVSPFGVWRNKSVDENGSMTQAGISNYDNIYADILLWLKKGWMDYCVPQLYWETNHKLCDYHTLVDWWNKNTFGKHLYIGHGMYNANTTTGWKDKNEIPNQIKKLRWYANTKGSVYFSSKSFKNNPNGWNDSLRNNYYNQPAIVPPMWWIDSAKPANPIVVAKSASQFSINYKGALPIKNYALFIGTNSKTATLRKLVANTDIVDIDLEDLLNDRTKSVFVAAVSKNNNISDLVELKVASKK